MDGGTESTGVGSAQSAAGRRPWWSMDARRWSRFSLDSSLGVSLGRALLLEELPQELELDTAQPHCGRCLPDQLGVAPTMGRRNKASSIPKLLRPVIDTTTPKLYLHNATVLLLWVLPGRGPGCSHCTWKYTAALPPSAEGRLSKRHLVPAKGPLKWFLENALSGPRNTHFKVGSGTN